MLVISSIDHNHGKLQVPLPLKLLFINGIPRVSNFFITRSDLCSMGSLMTDFHIWSFIFLNFKVSNITRFKPKALKEKFLDIKLREVLFCNFFLQSSRPFRIWTPYAGGIECTQTWGEQIMKNMCVILEAGTETGFKFF